MRTKTVQARHVHAGDKLVLGGDGVRRSAHHIGELFQHGTTGAVTLRYRDGDAFTPVTYAKTDPVRIRT